MLELVTSQALPHLCQARVRFDYLPKSICVPSIASATSTYKVTSIDADFVAGADFAVLANSAANFPWPDGRRRAHEGIRRTRLPRSDAVAA